MNLFVFGIGYSATHFIECYRNRFDAIAGTVTTPERGEALRRDGVHALLFDGETADPGILEVLAKADKLLVSIPPDERGDPVLRHFGETIAASDDLRWIGYLSTIGVYGDHRGAWVDETAPAAPISERSRQRVPAEDAWLDLGARAGKLAHIFRLAGIYGPGRNALAQLRQGTARRIVKPGQVFNRIHVDDIGAVLMASVERPNLGGIYNVADDEPAPPQEVVAFAAKLAGVEPPPEIPFEEAKLGPMAASFYAECKRAANRRIKDELGVTLRYPTYREGLRALRESGEGPKETQAA